MLYSLLRPALFRIESERAHGLALAALSTFAAPAAAQEAAEPKVNQLIVYGDDKCPESQGDEIVVCARMGEADRYRIPSSLRGDPNDSRNQAISERIKSYEYVGGSGTMMCSASGAGWVSQWSR